MELLAFNEPEAEPLKKQLKNPDELNLTPNPVPDCTINPKEALILSFIQKATDVPCQDMLSSVMDDFRPLPCLKCTQPSAKHSVSIEFS